MASCKPNSSVASSGTVPGTVDQPRTDQPPPPPPPAEPYTDEALKKFYSSANPDYTVAASVFLSIDGLIKKDLQNVVSQTGLDEIARLATEQSRLALGVEATTETQADYDKGLGRLIAKLESVFSVAGLHNNDQRAKRYNKAFEDSARAIYADLKDKVDFVDADNLLSRFHNLPDEAASYEAFAVFLQKFKKAVFDLNALNPALVIDKTLFDEVEKALGQINKAAIRDLDFSRYKPDFVAAIKKAQADLNKALHKNIVARTKNNFLNAVQYKDFTNQKTAFDEIFVALRTAEGVKPRTLDDMIAAIAIAKKALTAHADAQRVNATLVADRAKKAADDLFERIATRGKELADAQAKAAKLAADRAAIKTATLDDLLKAKSEAEKAVAEARKIVAVVKSIRDDLSMPVLAQQDARLAQTNLEAAEASVRDAHKAFLANTAVSDLLRKDAATFLGDIAKLKIDAGNVATAVDMSRAANDVNDAADAYEALVTALKDSAAVLAGHGFNVAGIVADIEKGAAEIKAVRAQVKLVVEKAQYARLPKDNEVKAKDVDTKIAVIEKRLAGIAPVEKIEGLENCGNTCYMNAFFQSLFHTREINQLLQVPFADLPFALGVKKDESLLKTLQDTFLAYKNTSPPKGIETKDLVNARRKFFPAFTAGAQDDSAAFITAFFDRLTYEMNLAQKTSLIKPQDFRDEDTAKFSFVEHAAKAGFYGDYSLINHWFFGITKTVVKKTSGAESVTFNPPSFPLVLNFPPEKIDAYGKPIAEEITLDDMYKLAHSVELLTGSRDNVSKQTTVHKAPPILVVQLSRFLDVRNKDSRPVTYPAIWNVETGEGVMTYELYSIIQHGGTLSGGHYTATLKVGGAWFYASDSSTRKSSEAEALGDKTGAYVLFYRKK